MKKKLTLTIEESVKERAKKYARDHQTSISNMVETYLAHISQDTGFVPESGSWTESIVGVAKMPKKFEGMDYKQIKRKKIKEKDGR